jgi:hypothetical protein
VFHVERSRRPRQDSYDRPDGRAGGRLATAAPSPFPSAGGWVVRDARGPNGEGLHTRRRRSSDRPAACARGRSTRPAGGRGEQLPDEQPYPKSRHGASAFHVERPLPWGVTLGRSEEPRDSRRARRRLIVRRGTCLRRDTRSQSRDPGWTECPRGAAWCRAPSHVTVPQPTGASASRRSACVPCPVRGSGSCCWSR